MTWKKLLTTFKKGWPKMWVKAAKTSDIAVGTAQIVEVNGRQIALFHVAGEFYAMDNNCPHQGGPLGEGYLEGKEVTCPWHAWSFDVTNGKCASAPGFKQTTFKTKVEKGELFIESDPNGSSSS